MQRLYTWLDQSGQQHALVAPSYRQARLMLFQQDKPFFRLKIYGFISTRSFKAQDLIMITKQLATMLKAGLPIIESLTLLASEHRQPPWQWLLDDIKSQLIAGSSLSQAIAKHKIVFPVIYQEVIAIGELTGQLDNCFEQLAEQLEKTQQLQQRIKKALRYPLFLFSTSILVTLLMLLVVLPKFADVYRSFDAELPILTQSLIDFSAWLQNNIIYFIVFVVFCWGSYRFHLKPRYYHIINRYQTKLPIIGSIILTTSITQVFTTLSMTQKSAIPLLSGLLAAEKTVSSSLFKTSLQQIVSNIELGHSFSQSIKSFNIYPNMCFQLILIGEESGTLDLMLQNLADYYQQKSEELTDNLAKRIEPIMMSVMAIIIGTLVIAMYLPIFQLGSVIH